MHAIWRESGDDRLGTADRAPSTPNQQALKTTGLLARNGFPPAAAEPEDQKRSTALASAPAAPPLSRRHLKTLLLVDDHPLFSEGARRTLEAALPELRVTTTASMTKALAILEREAAFDLCLSDQRLGDGEGADLVDIVRRRFPTIAVGVLTGEVTRALVLRLRAAGAIACLSKTREIASLARAVRLLYEGEAIFDEPSNGAVAVVSEKRREILSFAANGLGDKEIGGKLGITESTVRNHWQHIFARLDASNRTEAVGKAIRLGII